MRDGALQGALRCPRARGRPHRRSWRQPAQPRVALTAREIRISTRRRLPLGRAEVRQVLGRRLVRATPSAQWPRHNVGWLSDPIRCALNPVERVDYRWWLTSCGVFDVLHGSTLETQGFQSGDRPRASLMTQEQQVAGHVQRGFHSGKAMLDSVPCGFDRRSVRSLNSKHLSLPLIMAGLAQGDCAPKA